MLHTIRPARICLGLFLLAACGSSSPSGDTTPSDSRASIPEPWTLSLERSGGAADARTGEMLVERYAVRVGASGPRWQHGGSGWRPLEGDLSALEDAVFAVEWSALADGPNEEPTVGGVRSYFRFERPSDAFEVGLNTGTQPHELRRVKRELIRVVEEAHAAWGGASSSSSSQPAAGSSDSADRHAAPPRALRRSDPSECPHGLVVDGANAPESYVSCSENSDCAKVSQEGCCMTLWFALRADRLCYESRNPDALCEMECGDTINNSPDDGPRRQAACVDSVCRLVP